MLPVQQVSEPKEIDFVKFLDFFSKVKSLLVTYSQGSAQCVGLHGQALAGIILGEETSVSQCSSPL